MDYLTSAAPYHLKENPRVLVLGVGGGTYVLQAVYHGAASIDGVDLNPQVVNLVRRDHADFAGHLYECEEVSVHVAEARNFVSRGTEQYDVIQVPLLDAFGASAAGLQALNESYLYTVKAVEALIQRLAPGGLLTITRWVDLPPRDGPKLFATAVRALEASGVEAPAGRLAWIRGWKTNTLLIKNGPFTSGEIAALIAFCNARSFDVIWYPGIARADANRFNRLDEPFFYDTAEALLGPGPRALFRRTSTISRHPPMAVRISSTRSVGGLYPNWWRCAAWADLACSAWGIPFLLPRSSR